MSKINSFLPVGVPQSQKYKNTKIRKYKIQNTKRPKDIHLCPIVGDKSDGEGGGGDA